MVPVLALMQYPIQKVINGDSVVIMTTQQGRDINIKFEKQKKRISELNKQIDSLKLLQTTIKPSIIYISEQTNLTYYLSKLAKLDTLEQWLHNAAKKKSLVFYFDDDIVAVDLSEYYKFRFKKKKHHEKNDDENSQRWEIILSDRRLKYKKIKL